MVPVPVGVSKMVDEVVEDGEMIEVGNEAEDDGLIVMVPVEDTEVVTSVMLTEEMDGKVVEDISPVLLTEKVDGEVVEDVTVAMIPEEVDEVGITVMVMEDGIIKYSLLSIVMVILLMDVDITA